MVQITGALQTLRRTLVDFWYQWVTLLFINVVWLLCTVTVVLAPPALFGLFAATNELAHGRGVSFSDFTSGMRQYFKISWLWGVVNIAAALLVWLNTRVYSQMTESWAVWLMLATLGVAAAWVMTQLLAIPYLFEQERLHLGVALKNGLFTLLATPLYSFLLAVVAGVLIFLCFAQAIVVLLGGVSLLALLGNHAVLNRLIAFGLREHPDPATDTGEAFPLAEAEPASTTGQDAES